MKNKVIVFNLHPGSRLSKYFIMYPIVLVCVGYVIADPSTHYSVCGMNVELWACFVYSLSLFPYALSCVWYPLYSTVSAM